ncbi:ABC transporter substrate-binding protein [Deinococcus sp.]|uniref:ABC transporter substrate-binding protein n=1 Tax=Deinococcus sp. TaxID=47478 RepID=UPI0025E9D8DF|nr:ABC transporter substrate-binding protein [Deinococcus sp.]
MFRSTNRQWMLLGSSLWMMLSPLQVASAQSGAMLGALGKGEGQLSVIAWAGYLERGASDKAYDWLTPFEKQSGCKVSVKVAGSSDEMVSLMNQGGYDLVTASGDASLRLVYGNKVQQINLGLIPSYAKINPKLQSAPWNTVDGKHYGVPYQWGPNVLMYSTKAFKTPPTSWAVVFKEQTLSDGKSNKGRIQAYYGPIYIADAALYLMKTQPALGIKNPYELNEVQYKAALELLRGQRKLVQRYWNDANAQVQDFTNEGLAASPTWPFQVNTLQANKQPIASVVPVEGATGWADTTMLHVDAKHPNCAYKWLEYSLSPRVQGDVAAWFGSLPAVPAGCQASALLGKDGCKTNNYEAFDKIYFWKTPVAKCAQGACVPYNRWVSDYIAIQGGR